MKKIHTDIEIRDMGDLVICDNCSERFLPGDPRTGGMLFGSKAYCPECFFQSLVRIIGYGEEEHIKAICPEGMPFHDWCMELRGGDNTVKIITKELR